MIVREPTRDLAAIHHNIECPGDDQVDILLASSRGNPTVILKEAGTAYKVDTEAIFTKVRQEFAAKEKAKKVPQRTAKTAKKAA